MSVLKSKASPTKIEWKKHVLPAYMIFSIAFIIYTTYLYMQNVVYRGGYFAGQEQALPVGQKQGYDAAINELMTKLDGNCETLTLNLGEAKMGVLNAGCVQREPVGQANNIPVQSETPTQVDVPVQ